VLQIMVYLLIQKSKKQKMNENKNMEKISTIL